MRIGNRQLKYLFKQVYIFLIMILLVEGYFAYFLEESKYSSLAQNHYGLMLVGLIVLFIFLRGRQSFVYNDAAPQLSIRTAWFFIFKMEKSILIPKDQIKSFRIRGNFIYRYLSIRYEDPDGKRKTKKIQINYLSGKSIQKLKKSLSRILDDKHQGA